MTTSRAQWDWFNHIDTNFHGVSPFVNFGLANGRTDQHFLPRPFNTCVPFRTLGYMADFEGGLQYKVWRQFKIGFSVWDVLPMGPQKIYSELVWQGQSGSQIQVGSSGGITFYVHSSASCEPSEYPGVSLTNPRPLAYNQLALTELQTSSGAGIPATLWQ
jgi:hypothetical protein